MRFINHLISLGDNKASKLYGVKPRTIQSWRLKQRKPEMETAKLIVKKSKLMLTDIYT